MSVPDGLQEWPILGPLDLFVCGIHVLFFFCFFFCFFCHAWQTVILMLFYLFNVYRACYIWAAPSEFVSSSIPSWQTLTAHVQPFRGARDLAFCLKVPLDSLLVWASSEGSGEAARMRRLAWTFAARIGDKYQIRLARPICIFLILLLILPVIVCFNSVMNGLVYFNHVCIVQCCSFDKACR